MFAETGDGPLPRSRSDRPASCLAYRYRMEAERLSQPRLRRVVKECAWDSSPLTEVTEQILLLQQSRFRRQRCLVLILLLRQLHSHGCHIGVAQLAQIRSLLGLKLLRNG